MANIHFHALPPSRARSGEDPLIPFLFGARKEPVTISARDVHRLDAYRLQVLLIAEKEWALNEAEFSITDMSPSFRTGLETLGLDPDYFEKEPAQ